MAKLLSGKEVAAALNDRIKEDAKELRGRGIIPTLCIVRVGENPEDLSYERSAVKKCEKLDVECVRRVFPSDVSQETLLEEIEKINRDDSIHGVILFRPLPKHLNAELIENALAPEKDVDCMTDLSMSGVFTGKKIGFPPCTAEACIKILDHYGVDCTGKRAVVIGRSLVIGRPVAMMLMQRNATVTICHTRTVNMPQTASKAEILIAAAGRAGLVDETYISDGQIVLDVGINLGKDGKLCGDVDFESVNNKDICITPVPGGVGTVTSTVLIGHVVESAKRIANEM